MTSQQQHAPWAKERGLVESMDRAAARLLRVPPQPHAQGMPTTSASRPFETPLLVAAARCILRYLVLPFVLPLLGVAMGTALGAVAGAALGLLLMLDVVAVIAIVGTLRRLWRLRHPRRWAYLPVALALVILVAIFMVNDVRVLVG